MNARIVSDGTTETDYDDADTERRDKAVAFTQETECRGHSKAIMKAFKRAKAAGKKNDIRSCKIVASLTKERKKIERKKKKAKVVKKSLPAKRVQRTIMDF